MLKNIAWTGSVNLAFTFVALGIVDRAGRRPLMLLGSLGLAVIYLAMGFCYSSGVKGLPMLLLVLAAIGCYAMSLAPITWVVISEIFPNRIRGAAMSVAVASLWIACFILTYTFPILNAKLGSAGTFWLYAAICLAGFVFVKFKLPETKGKSLEQIEKEWWIKGQPMNRVESPDVNGGPRSGLARPGSRNGKGSCDAVEVRVEDIVIPTYLPAPPDKNPMFLEKRVYQGSSGKVYPLPFTDRIAEKPVDRKWKAIWIENEFIRVMVLPEIGGRIHAMQDKTNGYDVLYHQPVIKPALVGLAGPWISGGIEFNWPQHHRPATFLPVEFEIEEHADGSKTVWCSDHDPMARMKGMHGVCLHPGRTYLELKVRAYNRTQFTQTFLWWANVATRVHEAYQSFFPPDVYYVADHARRSMSEYPFCRGRYYGVDYAGRARNGCPEEAGDARPVVPGWNREAGTPAYAPNDLSFYANIPVPTSYMCMGSREDFFGGYDYKAGAGIIHYANHHISPGKKQWTWGNHEFGYAWDRNLTDADARGEFGPYIEIMAGVYTDNQPDFSFLQPGETKSWSQYWYPIQKIGPAVHANLDAALSLRLADGELQFGVGVTAKQPRATVAVTHKGRQIARIQCDLSPAEPFVEKIKLPRGAAETDLAFRSG